VIIDVLANDTDANRNIDPASVTIVDHPPAAIRSIGVGTGAVHFQSGTVGPDTFTYQVCDTTLLCASATVSITDAIIPQSPVILNQPYTLFLSGSDSLRFVLVFRRNHVCPPLAGLCTYRTPPGRLQRGRYRPAAGTLRLDQKAAHGNRPVLAESTPEWEVKEALSLHLYQDTEHAKWIRGRVSEMRNPPPRMDVSPDPALDRFFDELWAAGDTLERIAGLYGVLRAALLDALRTHYDRANPLVDHPTRRILRFMILEEEDAMTWGRRRWRRCYPRQRIAPARMRGRPISAPIWMLPGGSWAIALEYYVDMPPVPGQARRMMGRCIRSTSTGKQPSHSIRFCAVSTSI
jgi:hypothetical protein